MKKFALLSAVALSSMAALSQAATVNTISVPATTPTDETQPRVVSGDAPAGYGPDSWQAPATGKANVYFTPAQLFGAADSAITLSQIASVTYYSKNTAGSAPAGNWFFQVYTNTTGTADKGSFYHNKFSDGGGTTASTGGWDPETVGTVFQQDTNGPEYDTRQLVGAPGSGAVTDVYGTQGVLYFSLQTPSNFPGSTAQVDGLTVTLTNGDIGHVDLTPEPATLSLLGLGGMALLRRRR